MNKANLKLAWSLGWFVALIFACAYVTMATDGEMLGGDTLHEVTFENQVGNEHVAEWMWKYTLPERAMIAIGLILVFGVGGSLLFLIPFTMYVNGKKRRDIDTAFYPGATEDLQNGLSNDQVLQKAITKNGVQGLDGVD